MSDFLNFQDFLNESEKQSPAGKEFEELLGGILKDSDIIADVEFKDKKLTVIPNGKLGKIDVSLIAGLMQDKFNIEKLKKKYKGLTNIEFEKMTIDVK